jgi:hypothetical protein
MGNTVFISWSGERSRYVAEALRGWLPVVLQAANPWMSAQDAEKGTRWEPEIMSKLEESDIGIVCLTPQNLDSPWLLFEAGALAKKIGKSRVCTYLLDLTPAEVPPPMGMFQHTVIARDETRKLLEAINNSQAKPIGKDILDASFSALWPSLEEKIKAIPQAQEPAKPVRSLNDMMEELLAITRALPYLLSARVGPGLYRAAVGRYRSMAPAIATEVAQMNPTEAGQFDPFATEEGLEATAPKMAEPRNYVGNASPFTGSQIFETPLPPGSSATPATSLGHMAQHPGAELPPQAFRPDLD